MLGCQAGFPSSAGGGEEYVRLSGSAELQEYRGKRITLEGTLSVRPLQHLVLMVESHPHVTYIDVDSVQVVLYSKSPLPQEGQVEVSGALIIMKAGTSDSSLNSGSTLFVDHQVLVDRWKRTWPDLQEVVVEKKELPAEEESLSRREEWIRRIGFKASGFGPQQSSTRQDAPDLTERLPGVEESGELVSKTSSASSKRPQSITREKMAVVAPESKVAETTPKVAETTPKVAEATPKVAEATPKVTETTPKVTETTPKVEHGSWIRRFGLKATSGGFLSRPKVAPVKKEPRLNPEKGSTTEIPRVSPKSSLPEKMPGSEEESLDMKPTSKGVELSPYPLLIMRVLRIKRYGFKKSGFARESSGKRSAIVDPQREAGFEEEGSRGDFFEPGTTPRRKNN